MEAGVNFRYIGHSTWEVRNERNDEQMGYGTTRYRKKNDDTADRGRMIRQMPASRLRLLCK